MKQQFRLVTFAFSTTFGVSRVVCDAHLRFLAPRATFAVNAALIANKPICKPNQSKLELLPNPE